MNLEPTAGQRTVLSIAARIDRWVERGTVAQGEDCWLWHGDTTPNGYGCTKIRGKAYVAHRLFYEYFVAAIPAGLDLDHLCKVRNCVNPWHLDPVTRSVNNARATHPTHNSSKTHCPSGHPYDETNTVRIPSRPTARYCGTCLRSQSRERRARERLLREAG